MSKIILFPTTNEERKIVKRGRNLEEQTALNDVDTLVDEYLSETPEDIKKLKSTPLNELVVVSVDQFQKVILDFLIKDTKYKNHKLSVNVANAIDYTSHLLYKVLIIQDDITKEMLDNPYYSYWAEKEDLKTRADASVCNIAFPNKKRKNPMTKKDYESLALNGYRLHFGWDFAGWMASVIPSVEDFNSKNVFFERNFTIID